MAAKKLFSDVGPSEGYRRAHVGGEQVDVGMWPYIWGYRSAADAVVDHAIESGQHNFCSYPAAYLYRHGLELALKEAIAMACELVQALAALGDVEASEGPKARGVLGGLDATHSLESLSDRLSALLAVIGEPEDEWPVEVRSAITELHNLDPDGQAFRYQVRRGGRPSIPAEHRFDIQNLKRLGEATDFIVEVVCDRLRDALGDAWGEIAAPTNDEDVRRINLGW